MYIYEREDWTAFRWDALKLTAVLEDVNRKQGLLYGRLYSLGFDSKLKAMAENLTNDVVFSSEIEGIRLNADEVRSSVARKLGLENVRQTVPSHYVDSVVAVMLDALHHVDQPLTKEKLCAWQAAFSRQGLARVLRLRWGDTAPMKNILCLVSLAERKCITSLLLQSEWKEKWRSFFTGLMKMSQ